LGATAQRGEKNLKTPECYFCNASAFLILSCDLLRQGSFAVATISRIMANAVRMVWRRT
jgi:hypothetical protein